MAIAFLVTSLIRVPFAGFTTDQLPEFIILTVVCILPIWFSASGVEKVHQDGYLPRKGNLGKDKGALLN